MSETTTNDIGQLYDIDKTEGEYIALTVFCDYGSGEVTEIDQEPEFELKNGLFKADVFKDVIGELQKLYNQIIGEMREEIVSSSGEFANG